MKKRKAKRYNTGKPRLSLIWFRFLEPVAEVLEFGANKYGAHNWKKGLEEREILDSLLRHTHALCDGETYDQESGLHHIGHIICNCMFYVYFYYKKANGISNNKNKGRRPSS